MIRPVTLEDAKQIVAIYNHYVLNTVVTFDETPFSVEDFEHKIASISSQYPFIVYEEAGEILGYAYANKWREKAAYKYSVESTIYLKPEALGKHLGSLLYSELIQLLKAEKYHAVVGGLTLPNEASVKLHEKFGFEKVAHFKEVGLKFNTWLDVGFWQLTLD
ncbi:GNAT family N-acetyltransferase [Siansivirga zeaxanthinifaciens]|uniref:Phosphinothricin acetyltransferase n=1 Tax=Siansivirga zeaxanthinifaciens CC-SAMT-1 TaxID=1454006 RepID=A0A0C5VXI7_9FLAO|nr:GNAT family N-acetyltransferase [Siansivirga zeaxanthinifaciens]AJR03811.1 phosphinothricin acetyltransferase [Siansivirga zeaxanthinifaciens CC-SAMT-1]